MNVDQILKDLKCPDCGGDIRVLVEGELESWIRSWITCNGTCKRKWHIIYTGVGGLH